MIKKTASALGKGLDALLPSGGSGGREYFLCPIDFIEANPNQPRKDINDTALAQLSASILEKGVLLPLVVCEHGAEGRYQIIAGERRWRAAKMAGLDEVPVLVKDVTPLDRLELALIENIQRQDLNPLEEAEAYLRLVKEFNLTQEEVARRVGKERSTVANALRINQLPDFAKEDLVRGVLSMGHARVLLSVGDEETMREVRNEIVEQGLTVRQAEALAQRQKKKMSAAGSTAKRQPRKSANELPESYCKSLANGLVNYLDTKARIVQSGTRGKVEIEYYSHDDLERVLSLILPGQNSR
ncbi:MAG: ParB/RepB/Spo0J family partition protein [Desulfobulbaceae bacterium]|nr:ParB/RepB/Spo0J family partition protein [Desulfobulbaceae bacterium]HIJ89422.1 ParB/RepB/Spo0J family partition protein [Deltaproteobacteria bacterium]